MKRRIAIIIVALLVIGGTAWWLDVPTRLGLVDPAKKDLVLYGNVDIRQVELGFRVAGRIQELRLDEGHPVRAGDVLARLDRRAYEDKEKEAAAQVASHAAALAKLRAGPRRSEINQARAALDEREAEAKNSKRFFERMERLRSSGAVAQAEFDQAQAANAMSMARVVSARQELQQLQEGYRSEDIAAAEAALRGAQASLAAAQTALADTVLVAPDNGIVLSRVREVGAIVAPSDIAYVLSLVHPVWVRAYVSEPHLGQVAPGMEVTVISDSNSRRKYRGRVGFISPVAEFTPKSVETPELRSGLVYRLRIVIEEPDNGLRQGMPVTVQMTPPPAP